MAKPRKGNRGTYRGRSVKVSLIFARGTKMTLKFLDGNKPGHVCVGRLNAGFVPAPKKEKTPQAPNMPFEAALLAGPLLVQVEMSEPQPVKQYEPETTLAPTALV